MLHIANTPELTKADDTFLQKVCVALPVCNLTKKYQIFYALSLGRFTLSSDNLLMTQRYCKVWKFQNYIQQYQYQIIPVQSMITASESVTGI